VPNPVLIITFIVKIIPGENLTQENAYNETELLLMLSIGDEKAFRQMYEQYWNRIYTMALLYFKSPVMAQDMVQEVFLKVWLNRAELPSINNFGAWLHIIARNLLLTTLRKKTTLLLGRMDDDNMVPDQRPTAEEQLAVKETATLIRKAIEQLPPQQQKIYRMSKEQGLKLTEIAAALHLSHNTVREHMSKALKNIRLYLLRHLEIGIIFLSLFIRQVLRK
jgi:RNA polymerase sigma-70 factor (family 1)